MVLVRVGKSPAHAVKQRFHVVKHLLALVAVNITHRGAIHTHTTGDGEVGVFNALKHAFWWLQHFKPTQTI